MSKDKKPIAISFSDLHINDWKQFNRTPQERLFISLDVIRKLSKKAKKLDVPILFSGDLFHKENHITNYEFNYTLQFLKRWLDDEGVKMVGISGNHDMVEQNTNENKSPSYLEGINQVIENFKLIDNTFIHLENMDVYGIPYYTANKGFMDQLNRFRDSVKNYSNPDILLIHTDLQGAKDTDGTELESWENMPRELSKLFKRFELTLAGHIHKPQKLAKGVYMVGAPQQQTKKDKDCEMGYWIVYEDTSVEFKPLDEYPKFIPYSKESEKKDNYNFYYYVPPKEEKEEEPEEKEEQFSNNMEASNLVDNYFKVNDFKSKGKKKKLKNLLNTYKNE